MTDDHSMTPYGEDKELNPVSEQKVETHPIQNHRQGDRRGSRVPKVVTLRAYEAYSHIYSSQQALVTGDCRGGFGVGELIAFLYARSFPKEEWQARFDEACRGMENLT